MNHPGATVGTREDERPHRLRPRWTPGAVGVSAFVAAFLTVQVLVPLLAVDDPPPARFGWQMFSVAHPEPRFSALLTDGSITHVDLDAEIARNRPEVQYDMYIPDHVCATVPGAVAVRVEFPGRIGAEIHRCP